MFSAGRCQLREKRFGGGEGVSRAYNYGCSLLYGYVVISWWRLKSGSGCRISLLRFSIASVRGCMIPSTHSVSSVHSSSVKHAWTSSSTSILSSCWVSLVGSSSSKFLRGSGAGGGSVLQRGHILS